MTQALSPPRPRSQALGLSSDAAVNLPNALTLGSLVLGAWWATQPEAPDWAALASIILDEADGRVARATGQTSEFGSVFDWGSDIVLTALSLQKVGAPWYAIPAVATGQVLLRSEGYRPPVGSARAAVMLYGVGQKRGLF